MRIKECYETIHSDYETILRRLTSEKLIYMFAKKFFNENDYSNMLDALEKKEFELAFRYSHNLKGMSSNIGFTELSNAVSELCEVLREGAPQVDIEPMIANITEKYTTVAAVVEEMEKP